MLRSQALLEASEDSSIKGVVAMTRCSAFECKDASTEELERYVHGHNDPTIFFHVSGGAHIHQVIYGYRPDDYENLGSATLISYDLEEYRKSTTMQDNYQNLYDNVHVQSLMNKITHSLKTLVDGDNNDHYDDFDTRLEDRPLMNFLDSMQMQIFLKQIETIAEKKLSPSFLFKCPSLRSIKDYFSHEMEPSEKKPGHLGKCFDYNTHFTSLTI